ncbi:hypothetical protein D3C71_1950300 [compost metagenome]
MRALRTRVHIAADADVQILAARAADQIGLLHAAGQNEMAHSDEGGDGEMLHVI